jgi:endonuclease/exonuclease/phosphatase family metal-dependent hydrolase
MRILHWNIHGWVDAAGVDNVERVTNLIADQDADVVSLVEVDEPWGKPTKLRRVAETLGLHWVFVPAFEYRESGGFGNALLSKAPFLSVQQWQLLPPSLYDGTEPSEPRALLLADVGTQAGSMTVGSTHFPRSDDAARKDASTRLLALLNEIPQPHLICGDFNQPPEAWPIVDHLNFSTPTAPTYPAAEPVECIDYALAKQQTCAARLVESQASDHLPVVFQQQPQLVGSA